MEEWGRRSILCGKWAEEYLMRYGGILWVKGWEEVSYREEVS